jgi:hypothetical protein
MARGVGPLKLPGRLVAAGGGHVRLVIVSPPECKGLAQRHRTGPFLEPQALCLPPPEDSCRLRLPRRGVRAGQAVREPQEPPGLPQGGRGGLTAMARAASPGLGGRGVLGAGVRWAWSRGWLPQAGVGAPHAENASRVERALVYAAQVRPEAPRAPARGPGLQGREPAEPSRCMLDDRERPRPCHPSPPSRFVPSAVRAPGILLRQARLLPGPLRLSQDVGRLPQALVPPRSIAGRPDQRLGPHPRHRLAFEALEDDPGVGLGLPCPSSHG